VVSKITISFFALLVSSALTACGVYTPTKNPFREDVQNPIDHSTPEGNYEIGIVNHVVCEIAQGLYEAQPLDLPWLNDWGTTVTQSITVEDQSGLAPGITSVAPFHNVVFPFSSGGNVVSPGGSFTPTWKLARLTANTSSNLVVAQRTNTNDLIITLGPIAKPQPKFGPVELIAAAMNQHNSRVSASAIAVSIQGQSH
jgi:hypothetical protein